MITHDQVMGEMEFLQQQIEIWGRMANEQIQRFQQRIEELKQLDSERWKGPPNCGKILNVASACHNTDEGSGRSRSPLRTSAVEEMLHRYRESTDPQEVKRLSDELGAMIFGTVNKQRVYSRFSLFDR